MGGGARRQSGSERLFCFFFQAEDGIRDLVRSRGLGDVYKRQHLGRPVEGEPKPEQSLAPVAAYLTESLGQEVKLFTDYLDGVEVEAGPVSYTHLTLPTKA